MLIAIQTNLTGSKFQSDSVIWDRGNLLNEQRSHVEPEIPGVSMIDHVSGEGDADAIFIVRGPRTGAHRQDPSPSLTWINNFRTGCTRKAHDPVCNIRLAAASTSLLTPGRATTFGSNPT